ncbi:MULTISPECIES: phospholipase [Prauserella salsuginis group]|uniref:Phospholipase n=1 Tax=Prauserella salsuginis TaxID=387889 RepID=A0ABW6G372_9PSEU|nr:MULTISPECIES: phospholipase [Prauserella salsuginis group]MCR3718536.1 phospholipase A2 [Prauserella flava]MCR3733106.1 phospholipase A2 [Prauserella salsuginis]
MTSASLKRALRGVVASSAVAAAVVVGAPAAQAMDAPAITDQYLFDTSLSQFGAIRAQQPYPDQLDWSSDACSWSPDRPLGYDFTPACHRHDFGYRNYKRQGRFTEAARLRIDDNFYTDMRHQCGSASACNAAAWTYYQAVRQFGAS